MPPYSYTLPKRRLVSQEDQAITELPRVARSRFINRWSRITAFDAGKLIPIMVDEILPGDHMTYDVGAYIRANTFLFPMFSNMRADVHFWFVPNRLVWANWTKFMGEQANPDSSTDYTVPKITSTAGTFTVNSIFDHMGYPIGISDLEVNAMPLRAYNLIYNTWYRNQNLINSVTVATGDTGADGPADYTLLRRAKSHDYFTDALPWTQKFTAPTVPVGGNAAVKGIGVLAGAAITGGPANVYESPTGSAFVNYAQYIQNWTANNSVLRVADNGLTLNPEIYADLSSATGVAINTFRQAFMIQSLLERDARGGTRYVELIKSHFGVTNPDFRLQRPEYIGGGQSPLNITPIAQTAPNADDTGLGSLGGVGTATGTHRASYAATEHGFVLALLSIKSELHYQQGLNRMHSRTTRYDYFWPELAQLGEQAVLRKEIYATGVAGNDNTVFGYVERYHEYRTRYSEITGLMRSGLAGTLDMWHLGQHFAAAPVLNATFNNDDPPMSRVMAAGEEAGGQQFLADIFYTRVAVRLIPTYGTPATLGRF